MCGSIHSGRVLNFEIGVECRKILIVVLFYCCCEMYFGAISRYGKKRMGDFIKKLAVQFIPHFDPNINRKASLSPRYLRTYLEIT